MGQGYCIYQRAKPGPVLESRPSANAVYVPGCWLKKRKNEIVIFEQLNDTLHTESKAIKTPVLEKLAAPKL